MLRVVALRPLPILHQLGLCPFPRLWINERGDPDRNPFGLRAACTALPVAGMAIFESMPPMGTAHIPGLGTIIIRFPFIEGVAQHLNHTTLGPPPWGHLSRRDSLEQWRAVLGRTRSRPLRRRGRARRCTAGVDVTGARS
jgi:hypothetical protein